MHLCRIHFCNFGVTGSLQTTLLQWATKITTTRNGTQTSEWLIDDISKLLHKAITHLCRFFVVHVGSAVAVAVAFPAITINTNAVTTVKCETHTKTTHKKATQTTTTTTTAAR